METYNGKQIIRVYSSGHVFLSDDNKQVYLVTTEKDWKIQHQFTGWSPLEEENKEVIFKENDVYKFDIEKLPETPKVAPNAYIVSKKAVEILSNLWNN